MTKILILNGHPAAASLSRTFADTYQQAAQESGHLVRTHHVGDMKFESDFGVSQYKDARQLEPDLETFMDDLRWSGHVVLLSPMWWGGVPARLKGVFDRAFLPGTAFDPRSPNALGLPAPLLAGRTGRIVITSDTPGVFQRWVYGNAMARQLRGQIFGFVGIKPARVAHFAPAGKADATRVEGWKRQVAAWGARAR